MLNLIIKTALNNRLAVVTIAIAMMIYGVMQARQSPIDVLPDLTRPRVVLITECPGLAPEEVETLVTFPIEAAVNGATVILGGLVTSTMAEFLLRPGLFWYMTSDKPAEE
jgi:Cu/Ag efflux pump CusA